MLGLEAISAQNGWAMAITGTIIVMGGLSVLAYILSQLHKVIGLFEKKKKAPPPFVQPLVADIDILKDLEAAALMYRSLTADLGDRFHLTDLYRKFEKEKQPHPHLTISALRNAEYLLPLGEGLFCWKKEDQK